MLLDEGKKRGIKLTIIDTIDYEDYRQICDAIKELRYKVVIVDNGNTVFTKELDEDDCSSCNHDKDMHSDTTCVALEEDDVDCKCEGFKNDLDCKNSICKGPKNES